MTRKLFLAQTLLCIAWLSYGCSSGGGGGSDTPPSDTTTDDKSNRAPIVKVKSPLDNSVFIPSDVINLIGEASDFEDGKLEGSSMSWTSSITGQIGIGVEPSVTLAAGEHTITLTATDSQRSSASDSITIIVDQPPMARIDNPGNNTVFTPLTNIVFNGIVNDLEDGVLPDTAIIWTSNIDGELGTGSSLNSLLTLGTHTISLTVTDSRGTSVTDNITVVIQQAPIVQITAPSNNTSFITASDITFTGTASDAEDGVLSGNSLAWYSSIDGLIGVGGPVLTTLSIGNHLIRLTATDSSGTTSQASISITVDDIPRKTGWTILPDAPFSFGLYGVTRSVNIDDKFYISHNSTVMSVYDPLVETWGSINKYPGFITCTANGKLYGYESFRGNDAIGVYEYDPVQDGLPE